MRILMLVATSLATDTRVKREATALVEAGHTVHIVGRSVPDDFLPGPGITTSTVGTSSMFRKEGGASLQGRSLPLHLRLARWVLLPHHSRSSFARWAAGAYADAQPRDFDAVHAHDFTALDVGERLAREHEVPLVYDSHEYWPGRSRAHRPTPFMRWREARTEKRLGDRAAAVITVGDGVAGALRRDYAWPHVTVVRNSFPLPGGPDPEIDAPTGALYAGRIGPFRDLETLAAASGQSPVPIHVQGPADESWLRTFEPGELTLAGPGSVADVTARLHQLGISLVTLTDGWENNLLAMPNKIFHAVHAGVPVVVSDIGEIARITREFGIGRAYTPGDPDSLVRALAEVSMHYADIRANVLAARADLSWEADAERLREVYAGLSAARSGSTRLSAPWSPDRRESEDDE